MKTAVIIATLNRTDLLPRVLAHLERQSHPVDEVILSAPDESHVVPYESKTFRLSYVYGSKGLCAQRNRAMVDAASRADVITFFDDDFLPATTYFARLIAAFEQRRDWAVIMGDVVADGAKGPGFSFDEGLAFLERSETERAHAPLEPVTKHVGAYGCNMSIRTSQIGDLRFDERLALYGWQEDIDFTNQLLRHGHIVCSPSIFGVHLGAKSGRVSGLKLGYSQVCNPVYLLRKGTMPTRFALSLMARNMTANAVKSCWPEPYVDRRGRLRGNLLAAYHILRGKVEPEYILKI